MLKSEVLVQLKGTKAMDEQEQLKVLAGNCKSRMKSEAGKGNISWKRYTKVQNGLLQNSGLPVALLFSREDGMLSEPVYGPAFY